MTVRTLVACDGNHNDRPGMALEVCRGFLPVTGEQPPDDYADRHGWTRDGDRDLCPSCARARKDTA
jgi:hypothetical protein